MPTKAEKKAKAAADKAAAAQKAATTYNDQGLNAAQVAQIAKLQKQANQPVYQGLGGGNQAAIDKAKAEIEKIQAQGKSILDKQYQERQAPLIEATKQKAITNRATEAQQTAQQQAAQQQQLQQHQQQYLQQMGQRQDPRQSYANPYFQMTQNMPAPVGMSQGPNSQQAQTTMIGAGGNQPQQMSPAQMAQMQYMQQQQAQQQMSPFNPQYQQGMPQQGQQGMTPSMQEFRAQEAMMGRPPQADTFQPQGPQPQGGTPAQLIAMLQARAQQAQQGQPAPQRQPAPQEQPIRQDMSTFNAAQGGIMTGYK